MDHADKLESINTVGSNIRKQSLMLSNEKVEAITVAKNLNTVQIIQHMMVNKKYAILIKNMVIYIKYLIL